MERDNQTAAIKFIIVGFSDVPRLKVIFLIVLLMVYFLTLVGNLLIISIVCSNLKLHSPMYFFITNLSCLDIIYTTIIFPKMLTHFFLEVMNMSLPECLTQMYFLIAMLCTEFLLLAVMAYDRYVAICLPLRYMVIMNKSLYFRMAVGTWAMGLVGAVPHTVALSRLTFCESHTINHFFCDVTALVKLSCTSTHTIESLSYILGSLVAVLPFVLIITSYINIIWAILKIQTSKGRRKAFSTCASHLTVVILFYGTTCSTYMRPASTYSININKLCSLAYIAVTPLCNPIIYSLKNTQLKSALWKKMCTS